MKGFDSTLCPHLGFVQTEKKLINRPCKVLKSACVEKCHFCQRSVKLTPSQIIPCALSVPQHESMGGKVWSNLKETLKIITKVKHPFMELGPSEKRVNSSQSRG